MNTAAAGKAKTTAIVTKQSSQFITPRPHIDNHSVTNGRQQNVDNSHTDNRAPSVPQTSAAVDVYLEPRTRPNGFSDNGELRPQVHRGREVRSQSVDYTGHSKYANAAAKPCLVQWNSCVPVTRREYLEPVASHKDCVIRKESSRHEEQLPLAEEPAEDDLHISEVDQEDNLYTSVEDVRSGMMAASVRGGHRTVVLHSDILNNAHDEGAAMPLHDSIYEDTVSDARTCEVTDNSLHGKQSFVASSNSNIEAAERSKDIDTVAENAVVPAYNSIVDGRISDARRFRTTESSLLAVQSSIATANDEMIVDAEGSVDLLATEGQNDGSSAPSKTVDWRPSNHGS